MDLERYIRSIENFPKEGISVKDECCIDNSGNLYYNKCKYVKAGATSFFSSI
ncbi:MAG: hypothetical protein GX301_12450 [Gracilibacteraceae bacterium]|nr:hypothetical protein [Gracilibacteraceae bacterium]